MKQLLIFTIIGFFILSAFNGAAISFKEDITDQTQVTILNSNDPEPLRDEVDQIQTKYDVPMGLGWWYGYNVVSVAQTFTPRKNIMTRVFLYVARYGTPNTFEFAIREELEGVNLATVNKAPSQIPGYSDPPQWIEFDFTDIPIDFGKKYYFVCTSQPKTNTFYIVWLGFETPYDDGTSFAIIDGGWVEDPNADFAFKTYGQGNRPDIPTINGPTSGKVHTTYSYSFIVNDPDGDDVSYYVKWGDGDIVDWTSYQASGPPGYSDSHSWTMGTYVIMAKAKDTYGAESDWRTLTVTIPRNKVTNKPIFQFLQDHLNIF
jgi:hypothetical protein